jgi:F-type H+-transporting ATPase subunit delta
MYAASRAALAKAQSALNTELGAAGSDRVATAAKVGSELFAVVDLLTEERTLRIALADASAESSQRRELAERVFAGKLSAPALAIVAAAVGEEWSKSSDLLNSLVRVGREALLAAANEQNQLDAVEDELFRLGRIVAANPDLEQALSDRAKPAAAKQELVSRLLYGKATAVTEALAVQAVSRVDRAPADTFNELSELAALQRERTVAHVRSAVELTAAQTERLAASLAEIYGKSVAVHVEIDPAVLGGVVVRVGDEVIDGSAAGRLASLRKALK